MNTLFFFIFIVTLIFAILLTLLVVARIICYYNYGGSQKAMDKMRGIKRSFPIVIPSIVAIICWSWVIAHLMKG